MDDYDFLATGHQRQTSFFLFSNFLLATTKETTVLMHYRKNSIRRRPYPTPTFFIGAVSVGPSHGQSIDMAVGLDMPPA
jgi:hypothetical protein